MTANGAPQPRLTLGDLDRFLPPPAVSDSASPYVAAAAVLAAFDPFQLSPASGPAESQSRERALEHLLPMCEPITQGLDRGLWSLSLPDRRAALRRLGTRERMEEALQANPGRSDTPMQRMFERLLDRIPIGLSELSREDLAALMTVREWGEGILRGLPDVTALQRALTRSDLLAPMRRLADRDFVGRENELEQLERFVTGPKPPAPLFVFGPGGVGKSTLLARFLLEQVVPKNLPFAYIDVDRPTVRPDRPLTLILDAIAQFFPQVNAPPSAAESLTKEATYALARHETGRQVESVSANPSLFLEQFANTLGPWLKNSPAVVIVDTLEEAQFLGSDVMWPLMEFLFALGRSLTGFRLILAGRALPEEYASMAFRQLAAMPRAVVLGEAGALEQVPLPYRPLNLGVLDVDSARSLLQGSLQSAGLEPLDRGDLDDVIGIVTRNPMCLKLAARLLRDEGIEKLRADRSVLLAKLKAEKVQALLYGRILRHVHGEDVRKIAYPGLIVRRISPEVIRQVLAEPCRLELTPERNEYTIFAELSKEAALVAVDPDDGSLRHRADVRRAMLEDLTDQVEESVVESIDRRAVDFYKGKPGVIALAEEIYHRLRLRESPDVLATRWTSKVGILLKGAIDELPAQQRLWLAGRLGVTLDEDVRQAASQDAWEAQAARSADRFLRSGSPEHALSLLQERPTRSPRSPLYALEAETYRFLARFDDALRVARAGVDAASRAGAIDMALELLLKMVVIEEARGNLKAADTLLRETTAVASHSSNRILQLRIMVTRLRLQRQIHPRATKDRPALRRDALNSLTDDVLRELRGQPVLLREVAAELASQDARIAATAIETLGIEVGSDAQATALGRAIATLNKAQAQGDAADPALMKGVERFQEADFDPEDIRKWVREVLTDRDTRRLGGALATSEPGTKVLRDFRDYFRAGVAATLGGAPRSTLESDAIV